MLEEILVGKQPLRYNRHTDKIHIDMDWKLRAPVADLYYCRMLPSLRHKREYRRLGRLVVAAIYNCPDQKAVGRKS